MLNPPTPSPGTTPADEVIDRLGQQIGSLTVELVKRTTLLRQRDEQISYLREQLAARDQQPPTDAPPPESTPASTGS